MKDVKLTLKKKRSLLQMDELKCRKRVLRRLGYCTAADVIEMKGRVACEIDRYGRVGGGACLWKEGYLL
jgi:ATP-dependent RNA helicase DOB1